MARTTLEADTPGCLTHDNSAILDTPTGSSLLDQFETIYRDAAGDHTRIPWAHAASCPWLESWLNVEAPGLVRPGARVAVVGCGLGNDAAALLERGYEVTAFDACPSAIESCLRRFPEHAECFLRADLLDLPARMRHRYDMVVEVHTLQSMPPSEWPSMACAMSELLSHRGVLLAIARGREPSVPAEARAEPPFPLTADELLGLFANAGLDPIREVDDFDDDCAPPVRTLRGAFRRAG